MAQRGKTQGEERPTRVPGEADGGGGGGADGGGALQGDGPSGGMVSSPDGGRAAALALRRSFPPQASFFFSIPLPLHERI